MTSPGAAVSTNPSPSCQPRTVSRARSAELQLAVEPLERDGVDEKVASDPVPDGAPPDPAAVDRAQDVAGRLAAQETRDGKDVEDVKGVDRVRAVGGLGREPPPGRRPQTRPEARLDRVPERADGHSLEQLAAEPVGLDDAARREGRRCRSTARSARGRGTRPRTRWRARGCAAGRLPRRPHRAARRRRPVRSSPAGSGRTRSGRTESGPGWLRPRSCGTAARVMPRPAASRDRGPTGSRGPRRWRRRS